MSDSEREELVRRFPIFLVDYDPRWPALYEAEARLLREQFGDLIVRIEHIGSTAVSGLAAKPTIDILAEITSFEDAEREIVPVLMEQGIGYGYPSGPPPGHMAFWKGYYPETPIKYHYHMAPAGHPLMDRVYFRDYLRNYPETARDYERLKHHLAEIHENDRDAYTDAKAGFIIEITDRAKRELVEPAYRSVEGRPIEVHSFGEGERAILLMAGVHGDEKCGVGLVGSMLEKLRSCDPSALNDRIVVMPLVNPDGYQAGTRRNARGIDINRNFPTKDFVGTSDAPGGVEPASEQETRAILEVVGRFEPYLIITLHEPLACVNYNGSLAAPVAERMSECCGLPAEGDIGYPCPGSMGTYYGWERELPVITLELPPEGDLSPIEQAILRELGINS